MNKNKRLNIIRGGVAKQIPGMPNYYFMKGLPHELGGIDIGKDLEVEGNEVVHVGKDNIKVYSSVPFLNGVSPAEKVLGGDNPTTVFREQEQFKKINGLKDDGTKKELGGKDDDKIDFNYDPDIVGTSPKEIVKYYTNKGFGKSPITNEWGFISKNGYNYNSEGRRDRYDKEFDEVNKIGYIGGSPTEARRKFYKSDKRFTQVVDSIADSHGLPRRVLKNSLANEGFIDTAIGDINTNYLKRRKGEAGYDNLIGDNLLNKHIYNIGFTRMGNDDSKTYYNTRKDVKRIIDNSPIKWETVRNINEKDREVLTMDGSNNKANIVIHSALLTSFRNEIKKQHPNWTNDQIDNYTLYRFNYGPYAKGNINAVMKRDKFNAKNYEFRLGGKMNNKTSGLYSLTIDGKNSLHQFPSTGESFARSAKGKVIARGGTKKDINTDDWYPEAMTPAINSDMSLIVPDKSTKKPTPTKPLPKPKATPLDHYSLKGIESPAKQSKFKTFINNVFNKPNTKDIIGAGSNIVSSIIAHNMNKNMLNDLEYSPTPITRRANKLKTKININPQIDAMRESLANYRQHVNDNTASSRVAQALMNRGLNNYTSGINQLYGNKENQETELINKDRLNQQEVTNANIADYNTWRANKVAFNNTIREKKSENDVGLISNINAGIQDIISRGEKRFNERQNRLALMAANPNVNPSLLRDFGIEGITDEDIRNYYKAYGNKNKKG